MMKCPMCDHAEWVGYLKCRICGKYFVWARCRECGHVRLEKCPIDGGELELILPEETPQGEE